MSHQDAEHEAELDRAIKWSYRKGVKTTIENIVDFLENSAKALEQQGAKKESDMINRLAFVVGKMNPYEDKVMN